MKILIITPDVYPYQKGYGGRNPVNLFQVFSRMGNDTTLVTSVPDRELRNSYSANLIELFEVVRLRTIGFAHTDLDYFSIPYIQDILRMRKMLFNINYDIIILNDYFWSLSFFSIILMGKRNRSRTIMINHGIISPNGRGSIYLFNVFSAIVSKVFIQQFKGILSYSRTSHAAISKIVKQYDRLYIHHSCIDSRQFSMDYEKSLSLPEAFIRNRFGFSGSFIFAIGAASPHKGYEHLIRAFSKLLKNHPDFLLVIAGQFTPYTEDLKILAKNLMIFDKVKLIGPISDEEKFFFQRKCSIFAIPSLSEGFGAGAMEADALQLKVVATDTGAHRDILANNRFARIVVPGDDDELYKGMNDLLSVREEPSRTLDMDKLGFYSCESLVSYIISIAK